MDDAESTTVLCGINSPYVRYPTPCINSTKWIIICNLVYCMNVQSSPPANIMYPHRAM